MKRDLLADMREAFRQRDMACRKISIWKGCKSELIKSTCHVVLEVGDLTFYDLADIDVLKYPESAKETSLDFSGMTNSILALSEYYKNHEIHH